MKWEPIDAKYGDIVRVRVGSVYHYGVFASKSEIIAFGLPPVEKYKDDPQRFTVCATDAEKFSAGSIIEVAIPDRSESKKRFSPDEAVAKARKRIGETGYNIIHNNCEHFVNECVFGVRRCSVEEEARKKWLTRPRLDVYIAKTVPLNRVGKVYPEKRDEEIQSCSNVPLRCARYTDWTVLGTAAMEFAGKDIPDLKFKKTRRGKWFCKDFEFSLSHSGEYVAVAISNRETGIDVEYVPDFEAKFGNEGAEKLAKRFFTAKETEAFPGGAEAFLVCWTKKEALYKKRGKGVFAPAKLETSGSDAVSFRVGDGLVASVCGDGVSSMRIFLYDAEKGTKDPNVKAERI